MFKHLDGGRYAVAFFNFNDQPRQISFTFSDVGLTAASGLGLRFSPVLGSLEGTYSEYLRVSVDAHDCIVALCTAVPA